MRFLYQPSTQAAMQTLEEETHNEELQIHIDNTEQQAIEKEIPAEAEEKPLSKRARKKMKWVENIGKNRRNE